MPILKKHEEAAVWAAGRVPSASSTPRRGCCRGGRLRGGERNARASLALRRQGVGEVEKDCCGSSDAMAAATARRIRASAGEATTARSTAAAAGEATTA